MVFKSGAALEHQCEIPAREDSVLEFDDGASGLRRLLETRGVGAATARFDGAEPERGGILGPGRSVGAVADFPPRGGARPGAHKLHGGGPKGPRAVANAESGQHRVDSFLRGPKGARNSPNRWRGHFSLP